MKLIHVFSAILLVVMLQRVALGQHDLGVGAHYWKVIDDISVTDLDDAGISYFVSYRYGWQGPLRLELTIEQFADRLDERVYAPQAFVVLGRTIYAAAGIGGIYTGGSFGDDPFYAIKAGISLPLPLWLRLDIAAQYRFNDFAELTDEDRKIGTDSVFLGGALRLAL